MFSEIGLHFMFLGQMIYGCIQQSGMNTRKQIYVLHKNLSLPCNTIHSTHTYTQTHTHPQTRPTQHEGNVLDFGFLEFTLQLVSFI